jgi:hypothetical protein
MYVLSLASMLLFTFTIELSIWVVFGTAFLLGFVRKTILIFKTFELFIVS